MKNYRLIIPAFAVVTVGILATLSMNAFSGEKQTKVVIDARKPKWTISKHLVGLHMAYTFAPDKTYADGRFAKWAKESGVSTSRFQAEA